MLDRIFGKSRKKKITSPFHITGSVLFRYHSFVNDDTVVTVPDGVTEIAGFAFENCNRIEKIRLPLGIKKIGEGAFAGCRALRSVDLPETVTLIEKDAFAHCEHLQSITVPDSVFQLGKGCFRECTMLREISLSREMTQIPPYCFQGCRQLADITFPVRLIGIQEHAFENCRALNSVSLPGSVRFLYPNVFTGCTNLSCIELPERTEVIDQSTFALCSNLNEIRFYHRYGVLSLHNSNMRRQAGMITEFLRRPSTSQLKWMHEHCAVGLMMEFVSALFLQYPAFSEYLSDCGERFGQYLIEQEDTETLNRLLQTGWLSDECLRSMLDYAIDHTQAGGSAEPQMLLMRCVQPNDTGNTIFRL